MEGKRSAAFKLVDSKRMRIFSRMQRIYDSRLNTDTPAKLKAFKRLALEIDDLRVKFEEVIDEFNRVQAKEDEKFDPSYDALNCFDEMYFEVKDLLTELSSDKPQHDVSIGESRPEAHPRLPKIDLMDFDGDPLKWPLFFQTFKHLIHENPRLDAVSKIHYLLGKLKGKALSVCSGIVPTPENYAVLWNALVEKYEDKRALAGVYLGQILDFKPMTQSSVSQLGSFIERIDSAVRSLYQLRLDDLGDFVMTSLCMSKLDVDTRILFERSLGKNEFPSFEQLSVFVKEQFKILSRTSGTGVKTGFRSSKGCPIQSFAVKEKSSVSGRKEQKCPMCSSGGHRLQKCPQFLSRSVRERRNFVLYKALCFNCLKAGHQGQDCPSTYLCSTCNQRHHSLLHVEVSKGQTRTEKVEKDEAPTSVTPVSLMSTVERPSVSCTVLLSTAVVWVRPRRGERIRMRVLIDSASQGNFITESFARRLGLKVTPAATSVIGIGDSTRAVQGQTSVRFTSRFDTREYMMKAWVIGKITDLLPSCEIDSEVRQRIKQCPLADDTFDIPGAIDGLVGAELVPRLLGPGRSLGPDCPSLIQSPLGTVVMGRAKIKCKTNEIHSFCCTETSDLDNLVRKFWELEGFDGKGVISQEELDCEKLFLKSVKRGADGRYTVSLPFEKYPPNLGGSYEMALKRFLTLERKFEKFPDFRGMYEKVMLDYLEQDHMRLAKPEVDELNYYIPHHGILKLSSTSTPLRVVFDASAPSLNGRSLNDTLFAGPKLQTEILDLLILFRTFRVAMTADVRQMYRQIKLCPEHHPFQRLLWRPKKGEPIRTYELTTVAFGVKSSPYLALRTLQQLAADEKNNFPLAAERVRREIYMDDVVCSVPDDSGAIELYHQWVGLFSAGGFKLTKWATNSSELLQEIPQEDRRGTAVGFPTDFLTVLGMQWQPERDELCFKVEVQKTVWSKRSVLSTLARIWDPLGLLSPATISVKLLMKELWSRKLNWDDPLPAAAATWWQGFVDELPELDKFTVPRHMGICQGINVSLVGFADASEKAFAAVIYLVMGNERDGRHARLLCAKSKVAPMKTISIPRLELCGALLLARLMSYVRKIYHGILVFQNIFVFSDSTVVLHWLKGSPHRWKTFVANRVTRVHEYLPEIQWQHVRSEENPADCASRGLSPRKLIHHSLWLEGPRWLKESPGTWVGDIPNLSAETMDLEERPARCLVVNFQDAPIQKLIELCSSWSKLLRIAVYILRFARRLPRDDRVKASDLDKAEIALIKFIQEKHFAQLISDIQSKKPITSKFRVLMPFLQEGLLRVGGRLQNTTLLYEQRHPLLLPKGDHFTDLLIDYTHVKYLHAGPTLMAGLLRQKYWILGARDLIRRRCHLCNRCFKCKPVVNHPIMANLPTPRVSEVKPFAHTGVDFAGPFKMKLSRTRGAKISKGYLCVFICLSTRAIHLECASDLSTEICLAAVKRFLARRGPCSTFYSDQGTNFVGAKRYLDELGRMLTSKDFQHQLQHELTEQRIEWKLNPPAAPHFGGSWEAGVKSVKYHLMRVIGEQVLTFEEFSTVLCQIEAVLNSRPLCWLSTDPSDPTALTPAHFLTLTPLTTLPSAPVDLPINRLQRRELIDKMVQSYWSRWRLEYLTGLQRRMKWNTPTCPVQRGLLVLIHQENTPPLRWPLGRVQELYPSADGIVRVVLVNTKNGLFKRPVHKLAPLPNQ